MISFLRVLLACTLWFTLMGPSLATPIEPSGTIEQLIEIPTVKKKSGALKSTAKQYIELLKWDLSSDLRIKLHERIKAIVAKSAEHSPDVSFHKAIDLGMNGVPVLDQGRHGTCVTFAVTAGIDAAIGKGDYVSQLCSLQLGRYLEDNAFMVSGWDGSYNEAVINQLQLFGVISKHDEQLHGCAGLNEYPLYYWGYNGNPLDPKEYHAHAEDLDDYSFSFTPLLQLASSFHIEARGGSNVLMKVKKALTDGDRVIFGSLILDPYHGVGGAVGTYKKPYDSWILTDSIIDLILDEDADIAGHAMLIIGYDDDAELTDANGKTHKGLLKIRNSWGSGLGDRGEFYMSYDYFKSFVIEAYRVSRE